MNRRGFFAALVAAPLAAVAGLRPKPRFDRIWKMIDAAPFEVPFRETWDTNGLWAVHESTRREINEMCAIPETMLDMPKTKPFVDDWWRKVNAAMWGKE